MSGATETRVNSKATSVDDDIGANDRWLQARSAGTFVAAGLAVVAIWQIAWVLTDLPSYLLPAPADVYDALVRGITEPWSSRDSVLRHLYHTISAALIGFAYGSAAGITLGAVCARSPVTYRLLSPYIFGFQSMPRIALAPLLMVWFGFGNTTKVILAALLVFIPMFVNTFSGMTSVDEVRFRLFKSMGASSWQTLWKMQFPSALVAIFAGFEMAIVRALLGAVVAEFLAGQNGVGVLLIRYQYRNQTAAVFATLIVLAVVSMGMHRGVKMLGSKIVYWAPANIKK